MTKITLYEQVLEAWTNAIEGGHDYIKEYSNRDVALEMVAYDADLETENVDAIETCLALIRSPIHHPKGGATV